MSLRRRILCPSIAAVVLILLRTTGAQATGAPESLRVDVCGDPLPPGALVRMGTVRFRHGYIVQCLAFSPDGKVLASGSEDCTVRLWDVQTGKEIRRITWHTGRVESVAFSPDGKVLASCGQDGTVRLAEVATGRQQLTPLTTRGPGYVVAFSPDGKTLAASDCAVRLWDAVSGKPLAHFPELQQWTHGLVFAPDGTQIFSASDDGMIRVWEASSGKLLRQWKAHPKPIPSLVRVPGSGLLASASQDGTVRLWRSDTGMEVRTLEKGPVTGVHPLAVAPDGKTLAVPPPRKPSGDLDPSLRLIEVATGKELSRIALTHPAWVTAFSPDGKTLACGGNDSVIRLYDTASGRPLLPERGHQAGVGPLAFSPDDAILACGSSGRIHCWEVATGKELLHWAMPGPNYGVCELAFDDRTLLATGFANPVYAFDVSTGKERRRFKPEGDLEGRAVCLDREVVVLLTHPTGLAVVSYRTGKLLWQLVDQNVWPAVLSPDGRVLATHSTGAIQFWDVRSGKEWGALTGKQGRITALALFPEGKRVAWGEDKGLVCLQDAAGDRLLPLTGHRGEVDCLTVSPDGRMLASGGRDATVRVWEVLTGRERCAFGGHQGTIGCVAFSHDGRRLASGSMDTTALVWDLTCGTAGGPSQKLSARQLDELWDDLANENAAKAYRSAWTLIGAAEQTIPFLRRRLQPVTAPDPKRLSRLLADLDSDRFPVRVQAQADLEKLGEAAESALQKAAEQPTSAEVARQVKRLLDKLKAERLHPGREAVRRARALEVLEYAGTAEARELLQALAGGETQAHLTREARESLERLAKRPLPHK
jgi:WD40 repeat protein